MNPGHPGIPSLAGLLRKISYRKYCCPPLYVHRRLLDYVIYEIVLHQIVFFCLLRDNDTELRHHDIKHESKYYTNPSIFTQILLYKKFEMKCVYCTKNL